MNSWAIAKFRFSKSDRNARLASKVLPGDEQNGRMLCENRSYR
jgi:hypothetical protein